MREREWGGELNATAWKKWSLSGGKGRQKAILAVKGKMLEQIPDSLSLGLADVPEGVWARELKEPVPKSGGPGSAAGPLAKLQHHQHEDRLPSGKPGQTACAGTRASGRHGPRGPAASVCSSDPVWPQGAMTVPEAPIFSQPECGNHLDPPLDCTIPVVCGQLGDGVNLLERDDEFHVK